MSNTEKNNAAVNNNETAVAPKKEGLLTKMKNKVKNINWKKVGVYALNFAEGAALTGIGFLVGSKYGERKAGLIPGEGTVEEPEEDDPMEELLKDEEEA